MVVVGLSEVVDVGASVVVVRASVVVVAKATVVEVVGASVTVVVDAGRVVVVGCSKSATGLPQATALAMIANRNIATATKATFPPVPLRPHDPLSCVTVTSPFCAVPLVARGSERATRLRTQISLRHTSSVTVRFSLLLNTSPTTSTVAGGTTLEGVDLAVKFAETPTLGTQLNEECFGDDVDGQTRCRARGHVFGIKNVSAVQWRLAALTVSSPHFVMRVLRGSTTC